MQDKFKNWKNINLSIVVGPKRELLAQINGIERMVQASRGNKFLHKLESKLQCDLSKIL